MACKIEYWGIIGLSVWPYESSVKNIRAEIMGNPVERLEYPSKEVS